MDKHPPPAGTEPPNDPPSINASPPRPRPVDKGVLSEFDPITNNNEHLAINSKEAPLPDIPPRTSTPPPIPPPPPIPSISAQESISSPPPPTPPPKPATKAPATPSDQLLRPHSDVSTEPSIEVPFDFQTFLDQIKTKSAEPVARFLRRCVITSRIPA